MPEATEQKNYDENLGISLDFNDEIDSPLDTSDEDLLMGSLTDNDKPVDTGDDDLFREPAGIVKDGELDLNNEFDKLIKDKDKDDLKADSPDLSDDKSKKTDKDPIVNKKEEEINEDTSGSLTIAFARNLQEQGLSDFNEEEYLKAVEEKGEAVAFYELLERQSEFKLSQLSEKYDQFASEYVKYRNAGFSSEEASTMIGNLEAVNTITEEQITENEDLQADIIREVGQLRGMSKEEIEEDIQLLKDTDKLSTRANQGLKSLQGYYKKLADQELINKQNTLKAQKEADDKYLKELKDDIYGSSEIIKGKKINKQTQEKIYEMITKPIKTDKGNLTNAVWAKRNENPIEFDKRLAYLIHTGLFDGDTKALVTDAKTNAVKSIEQTLSKGRKFSMGAPNIRDEDMNISNKADAMKDFLND